MQEYLIKMTQHVFISQRGFANTVSFPLNKWIDQDPERLYFLLKAPARRLVVGTNSALTFAEVVESRTAE